MEKKFWFARLLPTSLLRGIGKKMKPSVVSHVHYNGHEGWLVGTYRFPEGLTRQSVLNACLFAVEKLDANVIGLGALTAPITAGGKWLLKRLPSDVIITSGNSLTAAVTAEGVQSAAELKGYDLNTAQIAILGATGSVGTGVSQLLIEDIESPNLLLISRTQRKLEKLKQELLSTNNNATIDVSTNLADTKNAELIVVLTSGPGVVLTEDNIREHAVVYDITQPSNISLAIFENRPDLLIIDGGLVSTPGLDWGFNMRLPTDTSFGCLAETIFLAENGGFENLELTGPVNVETARYMARVAKQYEHGKAYELLKIAQNYRYIIDIHDTIARSGIFTIITNPKLENFFLATALPIENIVVWAAKESEKFGPITQFVNCGVEIECGPRNSKKIQKQLYKTLKIVISKGINFNEKSISSKNFFRVYGKLTKSRFSQQDINQLKDFKKIKAKNEIFYPLLVGQYEDVACYKMEKIDFWKKFVY